MRFRSIPFEKLDAKPVETAAQDALSYLLDKQRQDGSWISPPRRIKRIGVPQQSVCRSHHIHLRTIVDSVSG